MSIEPDELYTLRNLFWLGSYQLAINEANTLNRLNPSLASEKEEFVYRSYLAMGQANVILNEAKIKPTSSPALRVLKLLAAFISADASSRESLKSQINEIVKTDDGNANVKLLTAIMCIHDDSIKDAIVHLSNESNLEQCALLVQLYLKIDRVDLAQKLVKSMKAVDEDSVLTMLSNAWTTLYLGPSKAQEASFIFDELIDKYGSSAVLLNGLAVSKMQQAAYEEAEVSLLEALTKAPLDPDTIANLISVSYHLNRSSETISRYSGQLKSKHPTHNLLSCLSSFDSAYDRVSATIGGN